jgi:predicted DNA-binding protein (MmcQ/YjbR family)
VSESPIQAALDALRTYCLAYPEAYEESPWGESAFKVRKKSFVFMNRGGDIVSMSVKLKESHLEACQLPFCSPTHYGMGKHGWVTCRFEEGMDVPVELLQDWIDVSFRTVAPKTLVKSLPESGPPESVAKPPPAPRTKHRVVILGHDDLRIERAATAFGARCEAEGRSMADEGALEGLEELDLLVIDLGRQEGDGLELAGMLAGTRPTGLKLILAGLRDAKAEVRARGAVPEASFFSRDPPGDSNFVSKALLV